MSKRNSNTVSLKSHSGLPHRLNSSPNATVGEPVAGEDEHLYTNFDSVDCGRPRAMTEIPIAARVVGKKPMPAPKPDYPKTGPSQNKISGGAARNLRQSSTVEIIPKEKPVPEEILYEEAMIVNKDKFETNDAAVVAEESLYAEPLAVAGHLLPVDERNVREAELREEPIYDEASTVLASRLTSIEKPKRPVSKPPPEAPEEHLYEDAAIVMVKKLPSGEVNGTLRNKTKASVEPIYCEAEPVVSRKLPVEQKNSNSRPTPVENLYAEAAEVKKSDESSDEEEPMYFNLLLLQKSIANQSLWTSRADPFLDKAKLEQNARRFSSAVRVLPTPPPKNFVGRHLGLVREESSNKRGRLSVLHLILCF